MNARAHLESLVGQTIHTMTGRPNTVLDVRDENVFVGTQRSPQGKPVPIAEVQAAMDMLERDGEIAIEVETVGYRSAFIGAVLLTVPGAFAASGTQRIRLDQRNG